jgi:hypothetical protein
MRLHVHQASQPTLAQLCARQSYVATPKGLSSCDLAWQWCLTNGRRRHKTARKLFSETLRLCISLDITPGLDTEPLNVKCNVALDAILMILPRQNIPIIVSAHNEHLP